MKEIDERSVPRVLSLLGLARRAQVLLIGQDRVKGGLKDGGKLLMLATGDCSGNVMSKLVAGEERGSELYAIPSCSRYELGHSVGVESAQVIALPLKSGFAENLKKNLTFSSGEADIDE